MSATHLDKIIEKKRERVEALKIAVPIETIVQAARERVRPKKSFLEAISSANKINIIAEFKRASPSKGTINGTGRPDEMAQMYEAGGAAAISVLTEEDFFAGSIGDLKAVKSSVSIPVLRKDFIIDEYQIYEAAAAGADAILLIVAALMPDELEGLRSLTKEIGLDALVEVHDKNELDTAVSLKADIIGVNNRNLKTLDVSLDVSRRLIQSAREGPVMVAESGIARREDIKELRSLGYSAFLVGETLMSSEYPAKALRGLIDV